MVQDFVHPQYFSRPDLDNNHFSRGEGSYRNMRPVHFHSHKSHMLDFPGNLRTRELMVDFPGNLRTKELNSANGLEKRILSLALRNHPSVPLDRAECLEKLQPKIMYPLKRHLNVCGSLRGSLWVILRGAKTTFDTDSNCPHHVAKKKQCQNGTARVQLRSRNWGKRKHIVRSRFHPAATNHIYV